MAGWAPIPNGGNGSGFGTLDPSDFEDLELEFEPLTEEEVENLRLIVGATKLGSTGQAGDIDISVGDQDLLTQSLGFRANILDDIMKELNNTKPSFAPPNSLPIPTLPIGAPSITPRSR